MMELIDRAEVVPMRLITREGLVRGEAPLIDDFDSAYVDLDDLLGSDDLSFQMNLLHFLTERFAVRNYERRIGTAFSEAEFQRAHAAGLQAETEHLRAVIGDPTIRFNHERVRDTGLSVFVFRSREGYEIVHRFGRSRGGLSTGVVFALPRALGASTSATSGV
jgi:hypothetical protein